MLTRSNLRALEEYLHHTWTITFDSDIIPTNAVMADTPTFVSTAIQ